MLLFRRINNGCYRLALFWVIVLIAGTNLACSVTYKGTAGDLSVDGLPVPNNIVEREDIRIALVYRPLYTHKETKNLGFSGPGQPLQSEIQQIVFIFEAKKDALEVDFAGIQLDTACEGNVEPRGVANVRDAAEMRQRVAEVPRNRRGAPGFDPLIELRKREEHPMLSLTPPAESGIDKKAGVSCLAGEMMMFELIYPLPSCYKATDPGTLVLRGIRVGDAEIEALEIAVAKRDYKYKVED